MLLFAIILMHLTEIISVQNLELNKSALCKVPLVPGKTCYNLEIFDDIPSIEDRTVPWPNNSIFFIDTSCDGGLDMHQACAVEAAARANPHREINVLFAGPVNTRCLTTSPAWVILKYNNVNVYRIKLKKYFFNTPLQALAWYEQRSPINRLLDVLKFITLYKFGGIYLDMNVLTVKSFDLLPESKNWASHVGGNNMSEALLALSNHGVGWGISDIVLRHYVTCFRTNIWEKSSADILYKALETICDTKDILKMEPENCQGFTLYGPHDFFPVNYETWREFIMTFKGQIAPSPFAFHIYNYQPKQALIDDEYLQASLMANICPHVQNVSIEYTSFANNNVDTEIKM